MLKHRYFQLHEEFNNFLFHGLNITDVKGMVLACFVVFVITVLLEGAKVLHLYWNARYRQDPLTYGQTDASIQERLMLLSSLLIPTSMKHIQRRRLRYHFYGFLNHIVNVIMAYFIMLSVMSYSVWVGISVLLGAGCGQFIFGLMSSYITVKYSMLSSIPILINSRSTSENEHVAT